jgi:hypothetical protein
MLITLASGGGPRCAANRRGTRGVGVIIAPAGQLKDANNLARLLVGRIAGHRRIAELLPWNIGLASPIRVVA